MKTSTRPTSVTYPGPAEDITPPHDRAAEMAVRRSALARPRSMAAAARFPKPEHFCQNIQGGIRKTLPTICQAGEPPGRRRLLFPSTRRRWRDSRCGREPPAGAGQAASAKGEGGPDAHPSRSPGKRGKAVRGLPSGARDGQPGPHPSAFSPLFIFNARASRACEKEINLCPGFCANAAQKPSRRRAACAGTCFTSTNAGTLRSC